MADIKIYGTLKNETPQGYVAEAADIQDVTLNKRQAVINGEHRGGLVSCSTGGSVVKKTIDLTGFVLSTDARMLVKFDHANTATNPTLNINGTGEKSIWYNGAVAGSSNSWSDNEIVDLYYDGSKYSCSMHGGAQFNTGEKVSNIGIENELIANSNNLVKNGVVSAAVQDLNSKIQAVSSGVKVGLSISPSVIYKGSNTSITLTGTMTNGTPTSMKLFDGSTQLASGTTTPITYTGQVTLNDNSKSYSVQGVTLGLTLNASAALSARYPIYYGFGDNATAVAVNANRYAATTTAVHKYTKTATASSAQHFYILVPSDIAALSTFIMNGAPFVMTESTETINTIVYKVYTSGNTYTSGTTLEVEAS